LITAADRSALIELDDRLNTLLPEEYQGAYDTVQPTPMGSAALRYDADGRVAWDEIWGSFCDLAMAGGPPHKGRLLEPGRPSDAVSMPERYSQVVQEICRGVRMVADLEGSPAPDAGWVRIRCFNDTMAAWLLRAITMENVAVRSTDNALDLPAAPSFRLEKEIKNVITVTAKTCHYWTGHMPREQQHAIARLFHIMATDSPLIVPARDGSEVADVHVAWAQAIHRQTGLRVGGLAYAGWLGVEAPTVRAAVWMMRALVVSNVLARREDTILYVPMHPADSAAGQRVLDTLTRVHHLAGAVGVLEPVSDDT
jgi:sirohydrochlorin cobaltochelatase